MENLKKMILKLLSEVSDRKVYIFKKLGDIDYV